MGLRMKYKEGLSAFMLCKQPPKAIANFVTLQILHPHSHFLMDLICFANVKYIKRQYNILVLLSVNDNTLYSRPTNKSKSANGPLSFGTQC